MFVYAQLNVKTVLFQIFQTIQFSINTWFSSIWLIDRALSGATIPGQIGFGSNGNEEVLRIPQSSSITGNSPSDCLVSYPGHSLEESLQRCSWCILQPQPTGPLNNWRGLLSLGFQWKTLNYRWYKKLSIILLLIIIIFTNSSARAGNDTRSISKRSLPGLNSEFSFS